MNIYPAGEAPLSGDALLYFYLETTIFPAFIPYHTDEQGNTYNEFVGETLEVTVIARIEAVSFYVKWLPGNLSAETVLERGYLVHNEVTARRLFPSLGNHTFKGALHGKL